MGVKYQSDVLTHDSPTQEHPPPTHVQKKKSASQRDRLLKEKNMRFTYQISWVCGPDSSISSELRADSPGGKQEGNGIRTDHIEGERTARRKKRRKRQESAGVEGLL